MTSTRSLPFSFLNIGESLSAYYKLTINIYLVSELVKFFLENFYSFVGLNPPMLCVECW